MLNSSVWPIDRTLSGAITPGLNGPRSNCNIGVLPILQNSSITGASPSDCLVSHPEHFLGEFYPFAEMQSVYSTVSADWTIRTFVRESYPSAKMQSVYSEAPADRANDTRKPLVTMLHKQQNWSGRKTKSVNGNSLFRSLQKNLEVWKMTSIWKLTLVNVFLCIYMDTNEPTN